MGRPRAPRLWPPPGFAGSPDTGRLRGPSRCSRWILRDHEGLTAPLSGAKEERGRGRQGQAL
eukprot:3886748-Pyramimonas_sp.AAC.1